MLLEFDLAGADWFVTAYLCRDENMIGVHKSGKSPHVVTGSRMFGLPETIISEDDRLVGKLSTPDEILAKRREKLPEALKATFIPRTKSLRFMAKKANHSLNYDEGYRTFALVNEIDERDAKKTVDLYKNRAYPRLPEWHKEIQETLRSTRTLYNCFGRKCYFMGQIGPDMFRQGYAFIPQSTVFDITGQAMRNFLDDDSKLFEPAELLAQVHDSLLTQYVSPDLKATAAFANKLAYDYMSPMLCYHETEFKIGVSMKAGPDWGHLQEVELTPDIDKLAEALSAISAAR